MASLATSEASSRTITLPASAALEASNSGPLPASAPRRVRVDEAGDGLRLDLCLVTQHADHLVGKGEAHRLASFL